MMIHIFDSPATLICLFVTGMILLLYSRQVSIERHARLPPGPKRRWLIGNLFDMPRTVDWNLFASWKFLYGDLVYLSAFGYSILVLNSAQTISDLLDKRSRNYSHRPTFVMAGILMGLNKSMALIDYGEEYKQLRKLTQHALNPDAIKKYYSIQQRIVTSYVDSLVQRPEKFLDESRLTVGRIILAITYGLEVEDAQSEYIADAEVTLNLIGKSTLPGAYLVDLIPALQYLPIWFPFTAFLQESKFGYSQINSFVTRPFEYVRRQMERGMAPPSFVSDLLMDKATLQDEFGDTDMEDGIKWAAGTMYGGGVESSYATIAVFYVLMALHPNEQRKAQMEIDNVIGGDQLVTIADQGRLPYVSALIQEVMRWHVVVPTGIARRSVEDDIYRGYRIPAGTIIVPNVWGLSKLSDDIQHPERFDPERFLSDVPPTSPSNYVFGFGRRVCPGKHLAENSIFLIIANVLALFNVRAPHGSSKNVSFTPYLVSCPEKVECVIETRSPATAQLIEQALATYET